ncbi:hypothetical protein A33M_3212 [Rhodovulum sp. PH10]|uniref:hypothetical protein n=1 Tax=Rhodovulum sp. PH10 TaxID=1187851 RepID=UPI00027C252C|nr:hypothetical protein [Rhodovulum sp. PH10]EJW11378.1 hypothetical protein A33M_3212 [Rhodovulum sp. PH10]
MRTTAISTLALLVGLGLATTAAYADSISASSIGLNGHIGGTGGSHTIVIDGVSCKLKNSTTGAGGGKGCNYTLSGGVDAEGKGSIKSTTSNQGCSQNCE